MSLEYSVSSLDGVDEGFRSLYRESDGGYVLDVTGVVAESKYKKLSSDLDQQRGKIGEYRSQVERFAGIDPDKYRELELEIAKYKDANGNPVSTAFDINTITDEQRKAISGSTVKLYEDRLSQSDKRLQEIESKYKTENENLLNQIHSSARERAVMQIAAKTNIQESAIDDALRMAAAELEYRADVEAKNDSDRLFTKDGIPFATWWESVISKKTHWLKNSVSGNPQGGSKGINKSGGGSWADDLNFK